MAVGSGRPMADAVRIAYRELIRWMVEDYGWQRDEAYSSSLRPAVCDLGNMVDPKYTMSASIFGAYL